MDETLNWRAITVASIISILSLLIFTVVLALALKFTSLPETYIDYFVVLFLAGSAFSGSWYLGNRVEHRILYHTLLLSVFFILFLLAIGIVFYGSAMTISAWVGNIAAILVGSIAGALTGAR
ncbi:MULTISPECIES: TIGR04086 family membrane protein [Carboxydocella]|uniref:Putative membrane protein, TIGR04086 family n=2 Tax=Carboxydocella TaxID=178898 RepID=A0A1T4RJ42_9FIRM|nr:MULTISPECIES: TIGR04086 family membrane protein [Carboxydocella]AVX20797.1 putative membrane protein, TIGR04086 family [Carboxydocella thermautotrophica]AVX31216.1 putative membrane protein, TIGR04086 family [Carboxydocella thermautotrophica]SKA15796.1 putative membrane protein, TIGR04086 family [Carboxydocella sporoproducens DSM 16521]GAW30030.1 hypothetical protein ULO1_26000 [Carboxydocella sp. ULO1]GAW32103.1 hypothetical protein JDF658_18680 [Carboxydocella sp. JDF658]